VPQDLLKITVVGESDLTLQVRVGADGMIPFPYINRTMAGGLTPSQFQDKLAAELADGWIKRPVVRVEIDRNKVQSVIVRGVVRAPGRFQFTGGRTLLEVLADAGLQMAQAGDAVTVTRVRQAGKTAGSPKTGRTSDASSAWADPDEEVLTVDLKDPVGARAFQLQDGDIVTVPEIQTFYITGDVSSQGNYVWRGDLTLADAVMLAGGLADRGTFRGATVQRVVDGKQAVVKLSPSDAIRPDDRITIGRRLF